MLQIFNSKFGRGRATRPHGALASAGGDGDAQRWTRLLIEQKLKAEARHRQVGRTSDADNDGMLDIRVAGPGEPKMPSEAFGRLRWGGLFACVDPNDQRIGKLMQEYDNKNGFVIEQPFNEVWGGPAGLRIPGITPRAFCFVARKTHLIQPGESTSRFTYDVTLQADEKAPGGYFVRKQVPTVEDLVHRLQCRCPDMDPKDIETRARKLVAEVFPIFLTRETKVLQTLQQRLPEAYRCRVPQPLRLQRNKAGFVTRLDMNWMRNTGQPITQLEFASQAADLLHALHEHAKIMHLDLRLDNVVITEHGVGFVDFGSAAQVGEDLQSSPVLSGLFQEMMRTSQIQRVLGQMIEKGEVTNEALAAVHGKVDRSVDAFYLAVQINTPHANPELERLIEYDPLGETAKQLKVLTAAVLKPKNPGLAEFKNAGDILRGIRRIEQRLAA